MPQHLFVGSVEGETSCVSSEPAEFDILPKLIVMVLLEGSQHFAIDGRHFRLDASEAPVGLMLNVARPARLRFIHDSEAVMSKVQISAPLPWLDWQRRFLPPGCAVLDRFVSGHLRLAHFTPGDRILSLARQLMRPPPDMQGEMRQFFRQSRGIDILGAVCALLMDDERGRRRPRLASQRQSERVRDYILAHLDEPMTLVEISRETGASISAIQRHFKSHFGMTISEFIRAQRLELANEALEQGVTVAQAAHIAHYADSAHFSTAFKRAYGVPPSYHRR